MSFSIKENLISEVYEMKFFFDEDKKKRDEVIKELYIKLDLKNIKHF
jgi:hypothetical protein